VSYRVALIDFVQFSRWCVFYSIIEYSLANWLMRIEKRIETAAAKVAKQEAAREDAARSSMDAPPGTVVELGAVQINGDADPPPEAAGMRRRSIKSRVLSQAESFSAEWIDTSSTPPVAWRSATSTWIYSRVTLTLLWLPSVTSSS
jgi:hypothetical protein